MFEEKHTKMARSRTLENTTLALKRAPMAWLVMFAVFVQAMMPLAHAWAFEAQADGQSQVICTASGVKVIFLDDNAPPLEHGDILSCQSCMMHNVASVVVPDLTLASTPAPISFEPFARTSAYAPSSIWAHASRPSRAPPLFL